LGYAIAGLSAAIVNRGEFANRGLNRQKGVKQALPAAWMPSILLQSPSGCPFAIEILGSIAIMNISSYGWHAVGTLLAYRQRVGFGRRFGVKLAVLWADEGRPSTDFGRW
jgi:hypothetical protein